MGWRNKRRITENTLQPYSEHAEQTSASEWEEIKDPKMFSRLLYTNPVCVLTTVDEDRGQRNAMVVSWLTPVNNYGCFIMSINKERHTATLLLRRKTFCLSPGGHPRDN